MDYNYAVNILVKDEKRYKWIKHVDIKEEPKIIKRRNSNYSPIIVGAGPAGLFCALTLIDNGYKPIIIEQGANVEERQKYVLEYRKTGKLNELCNVQFGEGGAGTFSDGKLTTGINSEYINKVLKCFYKFGAPKEILYLSHPHIGTDNLINILKNIRQYIESKGGKYYFNTKLIDINKNNDVIKVICSDKEFETDALVLAIGHSARDTFKMLKNKKLEIRRKNFSVGVRIAQEDSADSEEG